MIAFIICSWWLTWLLIQKLVTNECKIRGYVAPLIKVLFSKFTGALLILDLLLASIQFSHLTTQHNQNYWEAWTWWILIPKLHGVFINSIYLIHYLIIINTYKQRQNCSQKLQQDIWLQLLNISWLHKFINRGQGVSKKEFHFTLNKEYCWRDTL